MTESTARAERFDVQTAASPLYLWEVPQKPVSVRIPFSLIDRLEREAVDSFRSLTSRGSEIGGLLVGDVTPGSPLVVSIALVNRTRKHFPPQLLFHRPADAVSV